MTELRVFTSTGPASHDLAFEAELMERAAGGCCSVLVASWAGPVVVLGYAQNPEDVDLGWCRQHAVPVLRRLSGGTGVIHHQDLTVSLALPAGHPWAKEIVGLYDRFLAVLEPSLNAIGAAVERFAGPGHAARVRSPICFEDQLADTLLVNGRKVVGCSQTRRKGAVLIHAAVLLGLDPGTYARVFRVDESRVAAALAPAVTGVDWRAIGDSVATEMGRALDADLRWSTRPVPRTEFLSVYGLARWSPVPDDGMQRSAAELV
jgi:lipoate-protein ligase A